MMYDDDDDDDDDDIHATGGQIMLDNTTVDTSQLATLPGQPSQTNVTTADRFQGPHLVHPSAQQIVATAQLLQLSHTCPVDGADRCNLGLIPSSELSWPIVCRTLRSEDSRVHLHNVMNNKRRNT
ncbi:unnamed protein product [Rotaria sp. Silwood2]|nr:unnamed protein product [Rotaria sp. Silwood2]